MVVYPPTVTQVKWSTVINSTADIYIVLISSSQGIILKFLSGTCSYYTNESFSELYTQIYHIQILQEHSKIKEYSAK